jgi:alpha-tubulin suppressor-like RCC1 family protein
MLLRSDGTVWGTGNNHYGQLGLGDQIVRTVPTMIRTLNQVKQVAASRGHGSAGHTVLLRTDGTVYTVGYGSYGQLGLGDISNRFLPTKVPGMSGVVQVTAGAYHTVLLRSDGTVWAAGWDRTHHSYARQTSFVQLTNITRAQQVAAGVSSTIILK